MMDTLHVNHNFFSPGSLQCATAKGPGCSSQANRARAPSGPLVAARRCYDKNVCMSRFRPSKNVLLLVGVLLLAAAVRYYAEGSYASAARHSFHFPPSPAEAQELGVAAALATIGALAGAAFGYRLNRTSAVILGAIGGALATAHYSSLIGALVGGPVGLLVALLTPRRIIVAALSCAAALAVGAAGGVVAGAVSDGPVSVAAWAITAIAAAALVPGTRRLLRRRSADAKTTRQKLEAVVSLSLLVSMAVFPGIPLGITVESLYRLQTIGGAGDICWRMNGSERFTCGFVNARSWYPPGRVDKQQLARMKRFDGLESIALQRPELSDEDMALFTAWPRLWMVSITDAPITDAGAAHLGSLPRLDNLELNGTEITGKDFAQMPMARRLLSLSLDNAPAGDELLAGVSRFTTLYELHLNRTKVTSQGLAHLRSSMSLRELSLADAQISDLGLADLAAIPRLARLDVSGTPITDAGISALTSAASLADLDLSRTQVTDAGLAALCSVTPLTYLSLRDTRITDAGVETLQSLPLLYRLDLGGTQVTDASVDFLARLPKLGWINVAGTRMTPDGIERLWQSSRSGTTVEGSQR